MVKEKKEFGLLIEEIDKDADCGEEAIMS